MSDQRTKARLAVSEFQSALRARLDAERDFTRAHDQLGKFIDDLIMENEELRKLATLDVTNPVDASLAAGARFRYVSELPPLGEIDLLTTTKLHE